MPGGRLLEVRDLSKIFVGSKKGDIVAVDKVSFRAEPGRVFGLLGRNGAGKTTILRILATILRPSSGTVTVAGHDVTREGAQVRRKIGFMTGDTKLYERLSGREALRYYGSLMGLTRSEIDARIETLSARLGMKDILDVRIGKMSTGMLQKVSVSRVLLHEPEVLILDEPTTGLDVLAAREIVRVIGEWRDQGKTVIFSTHILREAERLCDTIAIIEKGKILGSGSLASLTQTYGPGDLEDIFVKLVEGAGAREESRR